MADSTTTPAEVPEPEHEGETAQPNPERTYGRVIVALAVLALVIIAIILLWLFWLRGLPASSTTGVPGQATQPLVPLDAAATKAIEEKVYAALRSFSLPSGAPLTSVVYIAKVAGTSGIPITITLTEPSAILALNPETRPDAIAEDCINVVLAGVPEVTSVKVIDTNFVVLATETRK